MTEAAAPTRLLLGEARTNSINVGTSNVDVMVPSEPLAVLHTGTGEIFFIPKTDSAALVNHHKSLSHIVAEYHSSNRAVQLLDAHRAELLCKIGPRCQSLESTTNARDMALQWQDEAHARFHTVFDDLDPAPADPASDSTGSMPADEMDAKAIKALEDGSRLSDGGKRLVELIAIRRLSPDARESQAREVNALAFDDGTLTKQLASASSMDELKQIGKWPKAYSDKLFYVRSDKIKPNWPKVKNLDKTKWSDVVRDEKGKRRFDKRKMARYAYEQADKAGVTWLKKILHVDELDFESSTTLGQWCEQWNVGSLSLADTQIADVDVSANAQLMRFAYGASLNLDFSISGKHVSMHAQGHAEVDLAKAEAALKLYFPRKQGWLWHHIAADGTDYEFFAVMFEAELRVSGLVGASIAAELSLEVAPKEVTHRSIPWVKGKPGPKGRKARRQNRAALKKGQEVNVFETEAGAGVFVGAKAEATLTGSLNWRDPETEDKAFKPIATIQPMAGGEAGLGAELRFSISYVNGMFRCTAHAGLCIGIGAEGTITFTVGVNEIASFVACIGTKIIYGKFKNLKIFSDDSFGVFSKIIVMSILDGLRLPAFVGKNYVELGRMWDRIYLSSGPEDFQRLVSFDASLLNRVSPEVSAMIASRIMDMSVQPRIASASPDTLLQAKIAVLSLLENVVSRPHLDNVIQHIDPDGQKMNFGVVMDKLDAFFKLRAGVSYQAMDERSNRLSDPTADLRSLAMAGDFRGWYDEFSGTLADDVPRGHIIHPATSVAYEIQKNMRNHPLYTSSGWGAYYADEA